MDNRNFIEGSREEEKTVALLNLRGEKYRLIFSKVYGDSVTKDILKIEITSNFKIVLPHIKEIIEKKIYAKIHLFVKYEEFLKLDEIDEMKFEGYEVSFVFIPKVYCGDEYVMVYEIMRIGVCERVDI